MSSRSRAAAAALICLTGCSGGIAPLGSTGMPIFGGVETSAHAEVGWLAFEDGFSCSAVLIDARRALTAAHCVYAFVAEPNALSVVFSAGTRPDVGDAVAVTAIHLAPDFTTVPSHDLAVLDLAASPPDAPVPYRVQPLGEDDVGGTLRLVGFGLSAIDDPGEDRPRRVAEVTLDEVDAVSLRRFSEGAGLCYGDSGAAVYLDGPAGLELVAVGTEGDAECSARGAGVRTDAFATFLNDPTGGDDDDGGDDDFGDDDDAFEPAPATCAGSAGAAAVGFLPIVGFRRRRD